MASILALTASSPIREPHRHTSFRRSSMGSVTSSGTVQHHRLRSLSGSSLTSLTSLWAPSFRRHDDSISSRSPSSLNLTLRRFPTTSDRQSASGSYSRRASLTSILSSRLRSEPTLGSESHDARLLDVAEIDGEVSEVEEDRDSFITEEVEPDRRSSEDVSYHSLPPSADELAHDEDEPASSELTGDAVAPDGMRKWMRTLRRQKEQSQPKVTPRSTPRSQRWRLEHLHSRSTSPTKRFSSHKPSGSQSSSLAFVTAVRSATATIASASIASVSRGHTPWRKGHQRSSIMSGSEHRPSVDSQRSMADEAAKQRSRKRREKLEELMRTEENYIADLKTLSSVRIVLRRSIF